MYCMHSLLVAALLTLVSGEEFSFNTTANNTNNTLFSRTKNKTEIPSESCEWGDIRPTFTIIPAIVSGFLILDGGFLCVMGYKQQRTSFSLLGFTIAGLVGYAIVEYRFDYSIGIQLLIVGAMALFVSILCSSVLYCGIFLTGISSGFAIGCIVILAISELHSFGSFAEPILILLGLGIVFASVTLWWKRFFIIVGTSIAGAVFIMGGLDYFIEAFLFVEYIQHIMYGRQFRRLCYFSWIIFAVFPVVAIIGATVQYFGTAKLKKRPTSSSHQELAMHRVSATSQSRV